MIYPKYIIGGLIAGMFGFLGLTAHAQIAKQCTDLESCLSDSEVDMAAIDIDYDDAPKFTASGYSAYYSTHQFPKQLPATGKRVFVFDPKKLKWAAYGPNGHLVAYGKASGGSDYCAELGRRCHTPTGVYHVYSKGGYNCRSSKYPLPNGGAWMPYCAHFHGGYAIHGSPYVPTHNASHGCIRVHTDAATWLHKNFIRHGTVVVARPYN